MTMHEDGRNEQADAFLAGFFDAGKAQAPEPSPELLARVLEQGLAVQAAGRLPVTAPPLLRARESLLRRLVAGLGGWGAASGLASVALAGMWLGFSPPESVASWADGLLGTGVGLLNAELDQADLLPSFDSYLAEG